uniref:Uncharacterized protein n=1 Tax=Vespula pensylvanica TaxID=30213 RepID=A0A834PAN9_VESPE|nr:hypothetical protein H0235_002709 [Vespula pensylvanica]
MELVFNRPREPTRMTFSTYEKTQISDKVCNERAHVELHQVVRHWHKAQDVLEKNDAGSCQKNVTISWSVSRLLRGTAITGEVKVMERAEALLNERFNAQILQRPCKLK